MKKLSVIVLMVSLFSAGCDSLRFAPTEEQKQNAWLHNETTEAAARTAEKENTSEKLRGLTDLSKQQSRAFVSYYGLPKELPSETEGQLLAESNFQLAQTALAQSSARVDVWELTDSALELGIAVAGLLGGVYGTRAVRFLKQTRKKSKALKEIVEGNELFKDQNDQYASAFKQAHRNQSQQTRQVVAEIKA